MSESKVIQIRPLNPSVAAIWEHDSSDYPDMIKIPMADGHVIAYRREIQQPEPRVMRCVDLIKLMKEHTYGGHGKHARKEDENEGAL